MPHPLGHIWQTDKTSFSCPGGPSHGCSATVSNPISPQRRGAINVPAVKIPTLKKFLLSISISFMTDQAIGLDLIPAVTIHTTIHAYQFRLARWPLRLAGYSMAAFAFDPGADMNSM